MAALAVVAMALPPTATAGDSPVPVPPPTPTPTPGRQRPDGPPIDLSEIYSLSLPSSEELQPLSTTAVPTSPTVSTVSVPVSAPLSRSVIGNLRSGAI
ncbi:MAG: hypothetical protein SNJ60_04370 [Pseudanabaenaceae cyanobacterium]